MVCEVVLVSDVADDIVKNPRHFRLKSREVGTSSRQAGKGVHFVVTLQVIHFANRNTHAVGVTAAMTFTVVAYGKTHADGKDGDVVRGLDLLRDLVKVEFAEGVHAGGDQDHILASFNLVHAVERVVQGVEQVCLGKTRHSQLIQGAVDRLLVLGEVRQDMRFHVVRNHRHPVIFLELVGEGVAGIQRVHHEVVVGGGEFHQQHGCNRGLRNIEIGDRLRNPILDHTEMVFLQVGNVLSILGCDQDVHVHDGH